MTNTETAIRNTTLAAKEATLRRTIAALPADYLTRIGLDTPDAIEAHVAAEMADEAQALEPTVKLTVQYRLPTSQHGTVRLLDIEIARADLPKVNHDWAVEVIRAYYDLPEMVVDVLAVDEPAANAQTATAS